MPKFDNWTKNAKDEWEFDQLLIINGTVTRPVVQVYRQGGGIDDFWAEIYFSETMIEPYSTPIDSSGYASEYAEPASSFSEAVERARDFMRNVNDPYDIKEEVNADTGVPMGWWFVERDETYFLFEEENDDSHTVLISQISRLSNHINAGKWHLKIRKDGDVIEDDQNIDSLQAAVDEAYTYMEEN